MVNFSSLFVWFFIFNIFPPLLHICKIYVVESLQNKNEWRPIVFMLVPWALSSGTFLTSVIFNLRQLFGATLCNEMLSLKNIWQHLIIISLRINTFFNKCRFVLLWILRMMIFHFQHTYCCHFFVSFLCKETDIKYRYKMHKKDIFSWFELMSF